MVFPSEIRCQLIERSQPKGVDPKMRQHKLRNDVNWQGVLKQKVIKWMYDKSWVYSKSLVILKWSELTN
jgi:hypothetical protein